MKKPKIDKFYRHEALDRTHVFRDSIYEHLSEHPYVLANKKVKKNIDKALDCLGIAYQLIGCATIKETDK